ncbi:hypothetical protein KDA00_00510 [Candidatus Saccharibacteria bacterium]|nr:hypothetical protein [Candidatus Saccharibacteria bacterium]
MNCIYCGGKTHVFNSRLQNRSNNIWRRRRCDECEANFTSIEKLDLGSSISVLKSDGSLEPFSSDKLLISIDDSLRHRKSHISDATALTKTIIDHILGASSDAVVAASTIQDISTKILNRFDNVASVHYKAYYSKS